MTITLENCKSILRNPEVLPLAYILRSGKYWMVLLDIQVQLSTGELITIKKGRITDLSSSPRFLWSLFPPFGDFLLAALVHDELYINNHGTRKRADREMLLWSKVLNPNGFDNRLRYIAVRLFGKSWWDKKVPFMKEIPPEVKALANNYKATHIL